MTVTTPAMRTAFHLTTVLPVRTVKAKPPGYPAKKPGLAERVLSLHAQGLTLRQIEKRAKCGRSTAWRITKRGRR